MRRSPGLFSLIFVILLSLAAPWAARGEGGVFAVRGENGEKAPGFALKDLSGSAMSLDDYKGKVVVLHFWASWCEPCKSESPAMERAYQRYKDKGFVVIGANVDDLTNDAQKFARRYGLTYPLVKYGSDNATKDFGTRYLPESFVIDRRGRVVALRRGEVDDEWLNENIAPVVAER